MSSKDPGLMARRCKHYKHVQENNARDVGTAKDGGCHCLPWGGEKTFWKSHLLPQPLLQKRNQDIFPTCQSLLSFPNPSWNFEGSPFLSLNCPETFIMGSYPRTSFALLFHFKEHHAKFRKLSRLYVGNLRPLRLSRIKCRLKKKKKLDYSGLNF